MNTPSIMQFEINKSKFIEDMTKALDVFTLNTAIKGGKQPAQSEGYIEIPEALLGSLQGRFCLLSDTFNSFEASSSVSLAVNRINAALHLIKPQFKKGSNTLSTEGDKFYVFHIVRSDINDIKAAVDAFKPVWKRDRNKDEYNGHKAFCSIGVSLGQAINDINLLCKQFTDDKNDHLKNKHVRRLIDSVLNEVAEIDETVAGFYPEKKQQA
jgi:hypothetical protein